MRLLTTTLMTAVLALPAFAAKSNKPDPALFKVDAAKSEVTWVGKKVTGQHDGDVKVKEGEVEIKDGKVLGGKIVIDMSSINTKDIKDADSKGKLDGHLKSEDFFDVAKFPTATFVIKNVSEIKGAKAGQPTHELTGELTIKGVTHSVTVPAVVNVKGQTADASATFNIDRTKWNVRYRSGKFFPSLGDKLIHDEFQLGFKIAAKK